MPVLDTSFLIDVEHKVPAAVARMKALKDRPPLLVPAIVALEFAAGSKDPAQVWEQFRQSYIVVDFSATIAERASLLAWNAMRRGLFPGWSDTQVAATALEHGEPVITRDAKAIRSFPDVSVEPYG